VAQAFRTAYKASACAGPPAMNRREWMLVDWHGRVRRHLSFRSGSQLAEALVEGVAHAYHSLGQYPDPTIPDMQTKLQQQEGADLLIDIDQKPGPPPQGDGHANLNEAWDAAKDHALRGIEILEHELDIPPKDLTMSFSGSKGYHLRCSREDIRSLDRDGRAELGCYLTGAGLRWELLFPSAEKGTIHVPASPPDGGVRRRIHYGLRRIRSLSEPRSRPHAFLALVDHHNTTTGSAAHILDLIHASGNWNELLREHAGLHGLLLDVARAITSPSIDQPVLSDLGRVARLVGSINGKSGLLCKSIPSPDALADFDPLEDATPFRKDERTRVIGLKPLRLQSRAGTWQLRPGQVQALPSHVAMVFLCSGAARVAH